MTLQTHHGEMLTAQQVAAAHGLPMSVGEVAERLKCSEQHVRKYYSVLGGIKLGRKYTFFSEDVERAISKLQQQQRQIPLDSASQGQREAEEEAVQDKKRGSCVGGRATEKRKGRVISDRHDLW